MEQQSLNSSEDFAKPEISYFGHYGNPRSFTTWIEPPSLSNPFSWLNGLRWLFLEKGHPKILDEDAGEKLPVHTPKFPINSPLGATWMGHATLFVRIDGISLLTDPVWSKCASPFNFSNRFLSFLNFCRRYRPSPCSIDDLPEINLIVISHDHYDHLDLNAVKMLAERFPNIKIVVPKGLATTIGKVVCRQNVHELDWGESKEFEIPNTSGEKYTVWSIPAQHWSQRSIFDRNKSLWSGWVIEGPKHKFFYTGDTGFCQEEFKKVGNRFGPIDLCAIPIGCYSPRWFMHPQHIDTSEAVQIHKLVRSKKSIAVHWGTYEMGSSEPYMEPKSKLEEAVQKEGLNSNEFITLGHGQSWNIENNG
uniref:Metallo-beta-lactamase domain-containing protein n=1 Tax=Meloidogyne enterolobii TaxID=390850 RepID=A0A6V7U2U2_MELEN|nr:unnamed protein product [Meloidogyne enterolobii]